MSKTLYGHIIPALLAALVVMVMALSGERLWSRLGWQSPAIEWQGVEVLTPTVRPGGILTMVYTARVNRQCPSDLRGFIIDGNGATPVRFPVVIGGYTRPSDEPVKIRVSIMVPLRSDAGLAPYHPGPHIYRTTAMRYCPEGFEADVRIPDAPFTLEVP
jgi:hypothetical protein